MIATLTPHHTHAVEIAATPDRIWQALVDPALTGRYYYGAAFHSTLSAGAPYAYGDPAQPDIAGTLLEVDPPRRLRMTARFTSQWLFNQEAREAPPHTVAWTVEPLADTSDAQPHCRVTVECEGFEAENAAFRSATRTTTAVLLALRNLLNPDAIPKRVETLGHVEIRDLTPALREDFLRFFDEDAFRDNPYWGSCYCTNRHMAKPALQTAAEGRQLADELVTCGRMQGFLAYVDGKAAAWCNAAPRSSIASLQSKPDLGVDDVDRIGSIVCFVTAAPYRRHGLARRLLNAAIDRFRRQGFAYAEAYPMPDTRHAGPGGDSDQCEGPLQLYLDAGFTPFRQSGRTQVVRKAL